MITATPNEGLGTGAIAQVIIGSDKYKGRIGFTTGAGITSQTLGRLNVGDGNNYYSDTLVVLLTQRVGELIKVEVQGEDSTGWEILTDSQLEENTTYEWNYTVTTIIQ